MPEQSNSAPEIDDKSLSVEDTVDILNEEETSEEGEEKETLELGKDGKDSEIEDEIEEELKEPDEEKLELDEPVKRREIIAKYPNIFKEFPGLEKAYYREQKYSELLPTLDDAKTAVDKAAAFDEFNSKLMESGSTLDILRSVKQNDEEAFHRLADNYLPDLYKTDQAAYFHVIGNIIRHTVQTAVSDSKANNRDDLAVAAKLMYEYVFGTTQWTPPTALAKAVEKDPKTNELDEQRAELGQQKLDYAVEQVDVKVNNLIKNTIDKNIDPRESMSSYVKKNAVSDATEILSEMIERDTRFKSVMDKLWEAAYSENYSASSLEKIQSAYLSKAKTLLPDAIKKARNEALREGRTNSEDVKDRKGPLPVGQTRRSSSAVVTGRTGDTNKQKARDIPRGTTTLDYLMRD